MSYIIKLIRLLSIYNFHPINLNSLLNPILIMKSNLHKMKTRNGMLTLLCFRIDLDRVGVVVVGPSFTGISTKNDCEQWSRWWEWRRGG